MDYSSDVILMGKSTDKSQNKSDKSDRSDKSDNPVSTKSNKITDFSSSTNAQNSKDSNDIHRKKYFIYKQKYLNLKQNQPQTKVKPIDPESLLDLKTKAFADTLKNKTPINKMSITDARNSLADIQLDESYKTNVDIETIKIPTKAGEISIGIFRPKDNKNILPMIIYYHGGGWILGNMQTHGRLMSEIAIGANTAVVYVGYSPAPEKKYPTQLIQAYDALVYFSLNGGKYNLDTNRIVLMGDSVGANMAIIVAMLSLERHGPKICYLVLMYPVADAAMNTESYQTYAKGPWLSLESMEWFFNAYEADKSARQMATISPLNALPTHLRGLPPMLIITDENDVLRDEGEKLAHKLMLNGLDVTAVRYLGTIHDFMMLDPLKDTAQVKSALKLILVHLRDALSQNKN